MTLEKPNLLRSYTLFTSEPYKVKEVKEERRTLTQRFEPASHPSELQPIFTLGRRRGGKALEI